MVNTAIIGAGYWGANLIRVLSEKSNLVYIVDQNKALLDVKFSDGNYKHVCKTTDAIIPLEDREVEAVFIATPPETHFNLAKTALEHGKHVFIEKPMTRSSEEAKQLVKFASKRKRLKVAVGHVFLYSEPVKRVTQILQNKTCGCNIEVCPKQDLGDILHISMVRQNLGKIQAGCDVIYDLAPHDMSMLLHWFPDFDIAEVKSSLFQHDKRIPADTAVIGIVTKSGMTVQLNYSWIYPRKVREVTFIGSKKSLVYTDTDPNEPIKIYDKGFILEPSNFGDYICSYRTGDCYTPYVNIREPLSQEVQAFLDCIEFDEPILNTIENGKRVVELMEKIKGIGHELSYTG
jgi:predicted dehydrogenase